VRFARTAPFVWAAFGGVLYFLGYVGYGIWPLVFVFLVPLWRALEYVRLHGRSGSIRIGLVFGLAAYAGGFSWLWRIVDVFLDGNRLLGAAIWLAFGFWFAAGFAVYALLFQAIRRRGWSIAVAGIAPLVAIEWLQPQLFTVNAGSALVQAPAWAQIADLGGPLLLTALVAAMNAAAFATWVWLRDHRSKPIAAWIAAATIACSVLGYGQLRVGALAAELRTAPTLRVGVVQANLGVLEKRAQGEITHERHLAQTRELLSEGEVDLVVWPETAFVRGLRRPLPASGRLVLEELTVPLLFGGTSVSEQDGRRVKWNSAFLIGADGMIRDAYDKNLLIPLAEYVPLAARIPAILEWFPHVQEFGASTNTPPLHLGPWRIATPICYEAIRPDFVRRMVVEAKPHLLVTLANDAWFGDSNAPWIHLHLARLRAIEHRRFLVRATNSGVSAIVDPSGRIVARTGLFTRENLRASVGLLEGRTLYTRFGDWPGWLSAAVVGLALVVRPRGESARSANAASDRPRVDTEP
jgi:apolipoprotein N-acyltransferase